MAIYRKIHTSFWGDSFVQELTPEQKYFFLYLLTNEKTTQCGIYEITKRQICYDTGYNIDTVNKLLKFFVECKKVVYSDETNEIALLNWLKYNDSESKTVQVLVKQQLAKVKHTLLIKYIYGNNTYTTITKHNITEQSITQTEEPIIKINDEVLNFTFQEFWSLYDKKVGKTEKLEKKWEALKNSEREQIMQYIPKYKTAQPIKQYRKNAETFLNNKSWLDELIPSDKKFIKKDGLGKNGNYEPRVNDYGKINSL